MPRPRVHGPSAEPPGSGGASLPSLPSRRAGAGEPSPCFTIVNVALPTIGRTLHFPESDLQWVVTAYGLTYAGFLLLGGRAADLLGRRRLLMAGRVVFTWASLGGGLATSDTFLIVMRGFQGLGAAFVLPAALST